MTLKDHRDLDISGATPAARDAFERALDAHLSWRSGAGLHLEQAVQAAPSFTMAHVLSAYFNLCSRDRWHVRQARAAYETASSLPATPRERLHVAAMGAVLADDFQSFKTIVQSLLDNGGNKIRAARALGMSRATIYRRIHEYGIVTPLVG